MNFNMNRILGSLILPVTCGLLLLSGPVSRAQGQPAPATTTRPAATAVTSNRFLFVMDTSAAMKSHAYDMVAAVMKTIRSSASGQIHNGDSVGVWTFNEDVFTGNLALQTWAVED